MDEEDKRRRLKREYGTLFDVLTEILFRHDPIGIGFEENRDEYDLEAETILPRLWQCQSVEDVTEIVHQEFQDWFTPEVAGAKEKYIEIAEDIWRVWSLRGDSSKRI
ncbi:MAG: hypothetical protein H7Z38_23935 [Rubrivivax sp.]|nr:hypothetical protein [Pyrinomonadaceae bacterium]